MPQFDNKIIDDWSAFLQGTAWAIQKYRLLLYKNRLHDLSSAFVRQQNWHAATILQGKMDAIDEIINISERIGNELVHGQLNVDEALNVMGKKIG